MSEPSPTVIPGTDIPLIVFVNSLSGGGKGKIVLNRFQEWLPDSQICDLSKVGKGGPPPQELLRKFINVPNTRVLMCGGDGTCSWLLSAINEVCGEAGKFSGSTLSAAVMPLGTGNDLSRALGFGHGYKGGMAKPPWARNIAAATEMQLDRWSVTLASGEKPDGLPQGYNAHEAEGGDGTRYRGVMYNYFSLGAEAAGLHGFHVAREANPAAFKNRLLNQAKMVVYGAPNVGLGAPCCNKPFVPVTERARVHVIDKPGGAWRELELPHHLVSILLVNIRSHAAGRRVWEPVYEPWAEQSTFDGMIEVAGISSLAHAGCYLACGFGHFSACSGIKLAQAAAVKIEYLEPIHVQADGEPWIQPKGTVTIELDGKSAVLRKGGSAGGIPARAAAVVPSSEPVGSLPAGWVQLEDPVAKHEYYLNEHSGATMWTRPTA